MNLKKKRIYGIERSTCVRHAINQILIEIVEVTEFFYIRQTAKLF